MGYTIQYSVIAALLPFVIIDTAYAIDCYVCTSLNRSDPHCEDAFNTSYDGVNYLQQACMGYRKDRTGYFPADHCIKIAGISTKNDSHTIMIRTCALDSGTLTADTELVRMSHCGHFIFENIQYSGCVQSCHSDGCNQAPIPSYSRPLLILMLLLPRFACCIKTHA